jgi:predicted  nucleic acid-binding Zn-ribbon protein
MSMDEDPIWYGDKFRHVSRSDAKIIQKDIKNLEEEIRKIRRKIEVLERTIGGIFHGNNTDRRPT